MWATPTSGGNPLKPQKLYGCLGAKGYLIDPRFDLNKIFRLKKLEIVVQNNFDHSGQK
jgi:hypothetical protein